MVAGIFSVALSSVLLLCGAGSVPIENLLPQGVMQGDLNAGGHNLTNAATLSAANVAATNSLTVPANFFSTNNVVQTTGSYANPSWLTSLAWSKLTGTSTNVPTPMTTLGDMMYGGTSGVNARLAGSTSSGIAFLTQTGTGSASAAPQWMSSGTLNLNSFALKNIYVYDNFGVESLDGANREFFGSGGGAPLNGLLKVSNSGPWTAAVAGTDYPGLSTANTFAASQTIISGNLAVDSAGNGLQVKEGSNAKQGTATLVAGTVTVSNTSVTTNSRIFLSIQAAGGAVGVPYVAARTAGTSFTITSTSNSDTSVVGYEIFEPAP